MKYQTITVSTKMIAPHITESTTVGADRLEHAALYPGTEFASYMIGAIEQGDLDRYWGPLDGVVFDGDIKTVKTTFNTLVGAEGWYNLQIDESDNRPFWVHTLSCQLIRIEDDGTFVAEIRHSDPAA